MMMMMKILCQLCGLALRLVPNLGQGATEQSCAATQMPGEGRLGKRLAKKIPQLMVEGPARQETGKKNSAIDG